MEIFSHGFLAPQNSILKSWSVPMPLPLVKISSRCGAYSCYNRCLLLQQYSSTLTRVKKVKFFRLSEAANVWYCAFHDDVQYAHVMTNSWCDD